MGGLFNSTTLDVMVGLIFVYLLLAIMCSSINEWIAGLLHLRSATLEQAVQQLLDGQGPPPAPAGAGGAAGAGGPGAAAAGDGGAGAANNANLMWLVQQFKNHPLISGMKLPSGKLPSYLPSRTFATAVMDLVTPGVQGPITFAQLQQGLGNLPDGDVKRALLALTQNAQNSLDQAQKNIEDWFDDAMAQASGWYKKQAARITFVIAILLTVGTNADTIQIARNLWKNPTARAQLVEQAKKDTSNQGPTVSQPSKDDLDSLGSILPGWPAKPTKPATTAGAANSPTGTTAPGTTPPSGTDENAYGEWAERVLGWILTIAAVSLGAPFWFDILGKIANLKNAGQKPKTAEENRQQTADANA
jgi:hypothetical protein